MATFTSTVGLIFIALFIIAVARAMADQNGNACDDEDFGTSMAVASMTGSSALGFAAGGSLMGAVTGEAMAIDTTDW